MVTENEPISPPAVRPEGKPTPETEPDNGVFESNYYEPFAKKVKEAKLAPEIEAVILEILREIDRQGIENCGVFEGELATFPVTRVSVNDIFIKIVQDKLKKLPWGETDLRPAVPADDRVLPEGEKFLPPRPENITTVILTGIALPPAGHVFTPWDFVYNQIMADLPRLIGAYQRGEELPNIEVHVFGSPNCEQGRIKPGWLEGIKANGFANFGKEVAAYVRQFLPETDSATRDQVRVRGISMGAVVAQEMIKNLNPDELKKTLVILDNPADLNYRWRFFKLLRAMQLPLGFGFDFAKTLATLPHYRQIYGGEKAFLGKFNPRVEKQTGGGDLSEEEAEEQRRLKKRSAVAEALYLMRQQVAPTEQKVTVIKGVHDLVTTNFGDLVRSLRHKFSHRDGQRQGFIVRGGHQRDNFRLAWGRGLEAILGDRRRGQDDVSSSRT